MDLKKQHAPLPMNFITIYKLLGHRRFASINEDQQLHNVVVDIPVKTLQKKMTLIVVSSLVGSLKDENMLSANTLSDVHRGFLRLKGT